MNREQEVSNELKRIFQELLNLMTSILYCQSVIKRIIEEEGRITSEDINENDF